MSIIFSWLQVGNQCERGWGLIFDSLSDQDAGILKLTIQPNQWVSIIHCLVYLDLLSFEELEG